MFLIFPRKKVEIFAAANIWTGREYFGRSCRYNSWYCMEERQHHLNESSSARLRRSQKLEILPSPNSKSLGAYFLGAYIFCKARRFQRPPCYYRILWDANILDVAHIFYICADILDRRECFIGANISWARIFHGREYFTCKRIFWVWADISRCAHMFWLEANILICADILRCEQWTYIFDWKRIFCV
jgi:hypothetical protein